MAAEILKVRVRRSDPASGIGDSYDEHEIPLVEGMRVLDVLKYISTELDSGLAFRFSCGVGNCGACRVKVDGRTVYACLERARDGMTIDPLPDYSVVRDIVVDFNSPIK